MIAELQNQVSLDQLLASQATLGRQDKMLTNTLGTFGASSPDWVTLSQGDGMPLLQLTA